MSEDHLFMSAGIHYYIAGRYAVFAGLNPVAANLLHHAVEMCVKSALSNKGVTLADLKDKFRHNLPKIWEEFKAQIGDPALDQFDTVISELHAYEEIRYPNRIIEKGMHSMIDPGRRASAPAQISAPSSRSVPSYTLYLGDIDELIGKVLATTVIPKTFTGSLNEVAKKYLNERNEISELRSE